MRRKPALAFGVVIAMALLAAVLVNTVATAANTKLTANLNGDKEVENPGDPNGTGSATVRVNAAKNRVCFDLNWKKISPPTAAHIHVGDADTNGDIVVGLFTATDLSNTVDGVSGCVKGVAKSVINDIKQTPGGYYVNVHTNAFPPGAIRGQLKK
jgi:CHRD domain